MNPWDAGHRLMVIGIGNPDRADDGIGPLVAASLASRGAEHTRIIIRRGDALALIEDWSAADAVVLIDAAAPNSQPGTIHRIQHDLDRLSSAVSISSTHSFGVAEAIGLARALGRLPRQVIVYAVEGASFEFGERMTAEVAAVAAGVTELVSVELQRLTGVLAMTDGGSRRRGCSAAAIIEQ